MKDIAAFVVYSIVLLVFLLWLGNDFLLRWFFG